MAVILITAKDDPASTNIKNILLQKTTWNTIHTFDSFPVFQHTQQKELLLLSIKEKKIFRENLDKEIIQALNIPVDQLVFLSKHTSKTKKPTLTVHPIGNYGTADFGGKDKTLVPSCPRLMTNILKTIYLHHKQNNSAYDVCYEVTHHGPYVETPSLFVEIGSSEEEWIQNQPAEIIAQSILEVMIPHPYEHQQQTPDIVLLGIGGGHYAPRFSDIIKEKHVAFGHMIPSYQIENGNLSEEIIDQAIQKTPNINGVYLHKKALKKSQLSTIKTMIEHTNLPVISTKDITT